MENIKQKLCKGLEAKKERYIYIGRMNGPDKNMSLYFYFRNMPSRKDTYKEVSMYIIFGSPSVTYGTASCVHKVLKIKDDIIKDTIAVKDLEQGLKAYAKFMLVKYLVNRHRVTIDKAFEIANDEFVNYIEDKISTGGLHSEIVIPLIGKKVLVNNLCDYGYGYIHSFKICTDEDYDPSLKLLEEILDGFSQIVGGEIDGFDKARIRKIPS